MRAPTLKVRSSLIPRRRADAEVVQAQGRVGGDLELRLDVVVVDLGDRDRGDSGLVEEDLLGVAQSGAGEGDLELGAALAADRPERRQAGASRRGDGSRRTERSAGPKRDFMDGVPLGEGMVVLRARWLADRFKPASEGCPRPWLTSICGLGSPGTRRNPRVSTSLERTGESGEGSDWPTSSKSFPASL